MLATYVSAWNTCFCEECEVATVSTNSWLFHSLNNYHTCTSIQGFNFQFASGQVKLIYYTHIMYNKVVQICSFL